MKKTMNNIDLLNYCNQLLKPTAFKDYCPNGLQVDAGQHDIKRILTGVTASQGLIDQAIEYKADLLLVHHGYFWKGEAAPLIGIKGKRIRHLMQNNISLMAYHLPLDAHPTLGNNAQLGRLLGFYKSQPSADNSLIWQHNLQHAMTAQEFSGLLFESLNRQPTFISSHSRDIKQIAWCTGAAQSYLEQAAELGADAFISGEISEQTTHLARELGIHYFAAGHHATERYGVKALGQHLAEQFNLEHTFYDEDNPV